MLGFIKPLKAIQGAVARKEREREIVTESCRASKGHWYLNRRYKVRISIDREGTYTHPRRCAAPNWFRSIPTLVLISNDELLTSSHRRLATEEHQTRARAAEESDEGKEGNARSALGRKRVSPRARRRFRGTIRVAGTSVSSSPIFSSSLPSSPFFTPFIRSVM